MAGYADFGLFDDDEIDTCDIFGAPIGLAQGDMSISTDLSNYGSDTDGLQYPTERTQASEALLDLAPGSQCPTVTIQNYDDSSDLYQSGYRGFSEFDDLRMDLESVSPWPYNSGVAEQEIAEPGLEIIGQVEPSQAAYMSGEHSNPLDLSQIFQSDRSRQRSPSEPWTPLAMGQPQRSIPYRYGNASIGSFDASTLSSSGYHPGRGTLATSLTTATVSQGTSIKSGSGHGGAALSHSWQQAANFQAMPFHQPTSPQSPSIWNGPVSAESCSGMAIDSTSDGHERQPISLSRTSSQHLSVSDAPASPTMTITPDFVDEVLNCKREGCSEAFNGTYRRGNLARHLRLVHNKVTYPCGGHGCDKTFRRTDARLKHQRKKHPELGHLEPRPRR